jgi:hypothetical protein
MARGLVMEVGGWLSHAAIQARECGLTCIVGVAGARDSIRTGDLVCLHRDGRVERLANRRSEERNPTTGRVSLERLEDVHEARLLDLSSRGAQIVLERGALRIGDRLVLRGLPQQGAQHARVARNGTPGNYGLSFEEPAAVEAGAPLS